MKHYFEASLRQLNTAITMPIGVVSGPVMDQVVVCHRTATKHAESLEMTKALPAQGY